MPIRWINREDDYKSRDHMVDSLLLGFYIRDILQWLPKWDPVIEIQKLNI